MKSYFWIAVAFVLLSVSAGAQWDDCPFGEVGDEYPGDCVRYVDTDGDGICDHSEPAPEDMVSEVFVESQEATILPAANPISTQTKNSSSIEFLPRTSASPKVPFDPYNAIPVSALMLILFGGTEYFVRNGRVPVLTAKYFWNSLLAVSFLVTALTSIPSLFPQLDAGARIINWHVEFGLVMIWVGLYHLWGRRSFYTKCFPRGKKKCD
ncbi:MAG: hypothetical protein ABH950_07940 [Candidatus Altiarchaeota archaeon]